MNEKVGFIDTYFEDFLQNDEVWLVQLLQVQSKGLRYVLIFLFHTIFVGKPMSDINTTEYHKQIFDIINGSCLI